MWVFHIFFCSKHRNKGLIVSGPGLQTYSPTALQPLETNSKHFSSLCAFLQCQRPPWEDVVENLCTSFQSVSASKFHHPFTFLLIQSGMQGGVEPVLALDGRVLGHLTHCTRSLWNIKQKDLWLKKINQISS